MPTAAPIRSLGQGESRHIRRSAGCRISSINAANTPQRLTSRFNDNMERGALVSAESSLRVGSFKLLKTRWACESLTSLGASASASRLFPVSTHETN